LVAQLGGYFAPPILRTDERGDSGRLAKKLVEAAQEWSPPAYEDHATGERKEPQGAWRKLERRLSKQAWLDDGEPSIPWPLVKKRPAIVTFFSFKGGVGRTTTLVSCAWQLADKGRRVAVLDLDLEAPGLGAMLEVETARGILDVVVDSIATGVVELQGASAPATALGAEIADRIQVFPAGTLDTSYLDKLSRLDFAGSSALVPQRKVTSPVSDALSKLLKRVSDTSKPDYILLDSRAGLHDLAGLSLHGLAHVDVLVSRSNAQGYKGLELAAAVLAKRKPSNLLAVVVHALAEPDPTSNVAVAEAEEFRRQAYAAFLEHIYEDDAPPQEAGDAAHTPWVLRRNETLQRFAHIGGVRAALFAPEYVSLCERIEELCTPEDIDEEQGQ
jgi:MinD-like ATPase involved in chromosome partitioning or flagellar assembly